MSINFNKDKLAEYDTKEQNCPIFREWFLLIHWV